MDVVISFVIMTSFDITIFSGFLRWSVSQWDFAPDQAVKGCQGPPILLPITYPINK
jgi:hypothetical protein